MGYKQGLHIHSIHCDGKDTLEELVQAAIEKGFDSIGFSGHSYIETYAEYSMNEEQAKVYREEISRLQGVYGHKVKIYCGLEVDNCTPLSVDGYDYLIGSVHKFQHNGENVFVDWTLDLAIHAVRDIYHGDSDAYVRDYYKTVAALPDDYPIDILGHFDLVAKFTEQSDLFDPESPAYKEAALAAVRALAGKVRFFEVNTGAMAKGYRTAPYPAKFIVEEMRKQGFGAIISSDCHDKNLLDFGYEDAKKLLLACGYTEYYVLTDEGFVPIPLED